MKRAISGLERWMREGPAVAGLAAGSRLGLLAHPASIDAEARHAVELFRDDGRWRLARLFAPEHGLWGHEQDMERVATTRDPATGLPVVSLYGDDVDSLAPRPEDLEDLDAVVVDLQDIGSRYYTYVYTLSYLMESAAGRGLPVIVLDRPNPLGGVRVEGPVLDPELGSFVGRFPLPVRHGMTIGELAGLFRGRFGVDCDLRVVTMDGWRRPMGMRDTGLPWVPPSPNMPTPTTAHVYPGGCLVEGTNLSEGRGTTTPFELVGAPWLDGHALAAAMRDRIRQGAAFRPTSFRPAFHKHAGTVCGGVQILPTDADRFRPFETFLVLLGEARLQRPERFGWRTETYEFESERLAIDLLLGRSDLRAMLEDGAPLEAMESLWAADLRAFSESRRDYLLY